MATHTAVGSQSGAGTEVRAGRRAETKVMNTQGPLTAALDVLTGLCS